MEIHPLEFCVLRMKVSSVITDSVQWDAVLESAICIATLIIPGFSPLSLHKATRPVYES